MVKDKGQVPPFRVVPDEERLVYRENGQWKARLPKGKEGEDLLARLAAAIAGPPKGSK